MLSTARASTIGNLALRSALRGPVGRTARYPSPLAGSPLPWTRRLPLGREIADCRAQELEFVESEKSE